MTKPKELRLPCEKGDHKVFFHDNVWYVPKRVDFTTFSFPGFKTLFQRDGEVIVEFCSGNGHWIIEQAKKNPEKNFLAVEMRFDRARRIWAKSKNEQVNNLIIGFSEAMTLSQNYFPESSISQIYVNFPDPWPKNRHEKHRLISPLFFKEAHRILKKEGKLILVTDDIPYSELFLDLAKEFKDLFSSKIPEPYYSEPPLDYGSSCFEKIFRSQGKPIRYHEVTHVMH